MMISRVHALLAMLGSVGDSTVTTVRDSDNHFSSGARYVGGRIMTSEERAILGELLNLDWVKFALEGFGEIEFQLTSTGEDVLRKHWPTWKPADK